MAGTGETSISLWWFGVPGVCLNKRFLLLLSSKHCPESETQSWRPKPSQQVSQQTHLLDVSQDVTPYTLHSDKHMEVEPAWNRKDDQNIDQSEYQTGGELHCHVSESEWTSHFSTVLQERLVLVRHSNAERDLYCWKPVESKCWHNLA